MKKAMTVFALSAAFAMAGPAQALDVAAYKAGAAIAAGSKQEADSCVMSSFFFMNALGGGESGQVKPEHQDTYNLALKTARHWLGKASAQHGKTSDDYIDQVLTANYDAAAQASNETHATYFVLCMERTPAS